jgi:hypothetical protein
MVKLGASGPAVRSLQPVVTLTWENKSYGTDYAPGTDTEIDVSRAKSIAVQADTTDADSTSTSVDVNIMASLDGTVWDSVPYAEANLGDAEVKTFLVATGPKKIRLRIDNNTNPSRADVTVKVLVIR